MAEVMFQNVAYRATVYRTGIKSIWVLDIYVRYKQEKNLRMQATPKKGKVNDSSKKCFCNKKKDMAKLPQALLYFTMAN